jgi:hypothetical protein
MTPAQRRLKDPAWHLRYRISSMTDGEIERVAAMLLCKVDSDRTGWIADTLYHIDAVYSARLVNRTSVN